jgi:hypothetical protein
MALRGKKPEEIKKRLKVLFYGDTNVGKTMCSIQFPSPYLIDTEDGTDYPQYKAALNKSGGTVFRTTDYDEIIEEVKELLTVKHEFKTLIIDSLSIPYINMCDRWAAKLKAASKDPNATGTEFGRNKMEADRKTRHLLNLLLRLDMTVIITAHSKAQYGTDMSVIGQTYDCYGKVKYLFDLVIEAKLIGDKHIGVVRKSRIESFPNGSQFSFNYGEFSNRYGEDILEKIAIAEELATEEQIAMTKRLINLLKVPEDKIQKWLDKAKADNLKEMKKDDLQKCIDYLNSQIKGESEAA